MPDPVNPPEEENLVPAHEITGDEPVAENYGGDDISEASSSRREREALTGEVDRDQLIADRINNMAMSLTEGTAADIRARIINPELAERVFSLVNNVRLLRILRAEVAVCIRDREEFRIINSIMGTLWGDLHALMRRQTLRVVQPGQTDLDQHESELEFFNGIAVAANVNGKFRVIMRDADRMIFMTRNDFENLYANRVAMVGRDRVAMSKYWLEHARRNTATRIAYEPDQPSGFNAETGLYNLWFGFAVQPAPGDWSMLREHIQVNICGGNIDNYNYLMNWLARLFQKPGEHAGVAIVLRGGEGVGKGVLVNTLIRIFGTMHAVHAATTEHVAGRFNAHLNNKSLLFADEAFFAADHRTTNKLLALITEPELLMEAKGIDATMVKNCISVIMASNQDHVVPAAWDSRRYVVFDVEDHWQGDFDRWQALMDQMKREGGDAAMLDELLNRDISNFQIRDLPVTGALTQQREMSLGPIEAWWVACLQRGYVYDSRNHPDTFHVWFEDLPVLLAWRSFEAWCPRNGIRFPPSRQTWSRRLKKSFDFLDWRQGVNSSDLVGEKDNGEVSRAVNQRMWRVYSLEEARARVEARIGPVQWVSENVGADTQEGENSLHGANTGSERVSDEDIPF